MAADPSSSAARVLQLRRPPVRQQTTVRSGLDHTFHTFVRRIGTWWPLRPYSVGEDRVREVTVQERAGGRVFETWDDGTSVEWGTLLAWEPPARFVMTWNLTSPPTEVELSFVALGPALTRVEVEHRGWERLTEEQLKAACALPGGYQGGAFAAGWARILESFAGALAAEARRP